jgi:transcriptional regulator with XRE-family HTH domain
MKNSGSGQTVTKLESDALALLKENFPYHCRQLRLALGYSQAKFAFQMGLGEYDDNRNKTGKITISRWESGENTPQERYLRKFMELQREYDNAATKGIPMRSGSTI